MFNFLKKRNYREEMEVILKNADSFLLCYGTGERDDIETADTINTYIENFKWREFDYVLKGFYDEKEAAITIKDSFFGCDCYVLNTKVVSGRTFEGHRRYYDKYYFLEKSHLFIGKEEPLFKVIRDAINKLKEECKEENLLYKRSETYKQLLEKEDEIESYLSYIGKTKKEFNYYQNIVGKQSSKSPFIRVEHQEENLNSLFKEKEEIVDTLKMLEKMLEEFV